MKIKNITMSIIVAVTGVLFTRITPLSAQILGAGQNKPSNYFGQIVDSVSNESLQGAVIHIFFDDDLNKRVLTRTVVAGKDGKFSFDLAPKKRTCRNFVFGI